MAIQRDNASVKTDITILRRRSGGAWVDMLALGRAFRRDTGTWVELLPLAASGDLSASVDVMGVSGTYNCNDPDTPPFICPTIQSVSTSSATVTSTGGTGSGPTYLWQYVSGDMGFTPSTPTAAATFWTINLPQNVLKSAVWKCTVTRGADSVVLNVSVQANYVRTGGGGGVEP